MNPDQTAPTQTAPTGAVWSGSTLFVIEPSKNFSRWLDAIFSVYITLVIDWFNDQFVFALFICLLLTYINRLCLWAKNMFLSMFRLEPVHEISNNVVCATSKASDQPAHEHSLIIFLFVFVALRPMSTAMVIAGRSVHLTTHFPWQAWASG